MLRWARTPRSLVPIVLVGCLLVMPTLTAGLLLDDVLVRMRLTGAQTAWGSARWWDLYTFARPELNADLRAAGFHPWWSDPSVKMWFFRPLAAGTHALDYALWPDRPALHHLHSVLWYGLAVAGAGWVYRRLQPGDRGVATLAAWLFALAAPHVMTVAWIAARNTLIAFALGCGVLLLHVRARQTGRRGLDVIAWLGLAVGLLVSEATLGILAYVFAWQLCVARGSWRQRLGVLLPQACIVVVWRVLYVDAGFGAMATAIYHDPSDDLLDFTVAVVTNLPALLGARWLLLPVDSWAVMSTRAHTIYAVVACVVLAWIARRLWPLVWADPRRRFWALGSVLSLLPFTATMPMDRLVLFAGLGSSALLAGLAAAARGRAKGVRRVVTALLVLHLPISAAFGLVRGLTVTAGSSMFTNGVEQAPRDAAVPEQTFVYVTGTFHRVHSTTLMRLTTGEPAVPRRSVVLGSMLSDVELSRTGPRTLEMRVADGFMAYPLDRIHRRDATAFEVGDTVALPDLVVEILALTADGRPAAAAFRFHVPLEDDSLRWLVVEPVPDGLPMEVHTREFEVPAVGQRLALDGIL